MIDPEYTLTVSVKKSDLKRMQYETHSLMSEDNITRQFIDSLVAPIMESESS